MEKVWTPCKYTKFLDRCWKKNNRCWKKELKKGPMLKKERRISFSKCRRLQCSDRCTGEWTNTVHRIGQFHFQVSKTKMFWSMLKMQPHSTNPSNTILIGGCNLNVYKEKQIETPTVKVQKIMDSEKGSKMKPQQKVWTTCKCTKNFWKKRSRTPLWFMDSEKGSKMKPHQCFSFQVTKNNSKQFRRWRVQSRPERVRRGRLQTV